MGRGLGMPLGPGVLNLPAIIAAAVAAATQGYDAAAAASPSAAAAAPLARVLSLMNMLHMLFICRVVTNAEIPRI